jgi:hypothetical protein
MEKNRAPYPRDAPLISRHMLRFILGHAAWQVIFPLIRSRLGLLFFKGREGDGGGMCESQGLTQEWGCQAPLPPPLPPFFKYTHTYTGGGAIRAAAASILGFFGTLIGLFRGNFFFRSR